MEAMISKRHACRTIELKEMFHSLANAVRLKGQEAFCRPVEGGIVYQFRLGENICTYSVVKGGAL